MRTPSLRHYALAVLTTHAFAACKQPATSRVLETDDGISAQQCPSDAGGGGLGGQSRLGSPGLSPTGGEEPPTTVAAATSDTEETLALLGDERATFQPSFDQFRADLGRNKGADGGLQAWCFQGVEQSPQTERYRNQDVTGFCHDVWVAWWNGVKLGRADYRQWYESHIQGWPFQAVKVCERVAVTPGQSGEQGEKRSFKDDPRVIAAKDCAKNALPLPNVAQDQIEKLLDTEGTLPDGYLQAPPAWLQDALKRVPGGNAINSMTAFAQCFINLPIAIVAAKFEPWFAEARKALDARVDQNVADPRFGQASGASCGAGGFVRSDAKVDGCAEGGTSLSQCPCGPSLQEARSAGATCQETVKGLRCRNGSGYPY